MDGLMWIAAYCAVVAVVAAGLNAAFPKWSKRALVVVSTGLLPCLFLIAGVVVAARIISQPISPGDLHGPGYAIAGVMYITTVAVFGGLLLGGFVSTVTVGFLRGTEN